MADHRNDDYRGKIEARLAKDVAGKTIKSWAEQRLRAKFEEEPRAGA